MKNLKKTLVSLFIIAAMMMSMIVVVSASSDYTTILKAYNGISADVGTMNGVWKVVEESNGNKYYSTTGGIDGMLNTPANTGKGGIIKASFDFKFTLTAGRGYVSLYNDGQQHNKANMLTLLYKDEGTMRTAGNGMFVPTLHEWYTEEAVIDLDDKNVNIVIYNKATGEKVATLEKQLELSSSNHTGWSNLGENSFEYFLFAANSDNGKGVLDLDNFKVERYCTTELKALTDLQNVATGTMNGVWKVVEESNGNKYYSTTGGIRDMLNAPANTGAGGKVKASFDFKFTLTAGRGYVSLYNSGQQHNKANMLTLLYKDEGTMRTAGNGMFVPTLHEWYTEEAVIDLDNKNISVVIYNKATGETVATLNKQLELSGSEHTGWSNAGENSFEYFLFAANSDAGKGVVDIDNLKVEKYEELTEIPVEEVPVEKVLYSNDLESGKILDKTTTVADPTDATNNVAKYNAGWAQPEIKLSETVSSGIVQVKFDYMANATNSSFHVDLIGSSRTAEEYLTLFRRNGTTIEGAAAGTYGTVETGKWYSVNTVININTKHYMSVVKDKATGKVLKSVDATLTPTSDQFKYWPKSISEFTAFFFQGGSADDYLDNILVKTLLEEPEMEQEDKVLYSNDLESGKTLDKTTTVTDPTDSANNVAKYNSGWAQPNIPLSEKVNSGIVQVKFDYMANATNSSFHVDLIGSSRTAEEYLTLFRRNGTTIEGAAAGTYGAVETGKWYSVNTVINVETKHYMSVVKDKATGRVLESVDATLEPTSDQFKYWPKTVNEFTAFFFQGGSADDYLDNIFVTTLSVEPEMEQKLTEKELYSNDLESGKTLDKTTTVADPTESANNVAKYNSGWAQPNIPLSETVNSGIVQVKFDYMANATNSSFHVDLIGSSRTAEEYLTLFRRNGTTIEGAAAGTYGTVETGKWYSVNTVINIDTKHYMSVVKDKATGKVLKSVDATLEPTSDQFKYWPKTVNEFTAFFFQGGSTEDYLDNILVKTLLEEPEMEQEEVDPRLLYSNDFQTGSAPANGTINTDNTNKYLTLNGGWKNIQYKFDEVTTDKIKVTFDFMNTESGSSFYAALLDSSVSNSDGTEFLTLIRDEKKMECYSSTQNRNILGDHIDNEWLTYEAVIDMNTKKCISTVYNKATAEAIATVEVTLAPSDANLADWPKTATAFDTFMIASGRENGTHMDNLLIEKVVEAPVVSADKVTIKDASGEVQSVWTKVSPSAKVFEIGFGTSLDKDTVTKDSIYVTKKGSTSPLAGNVDYADGKAVLTLTDALEINTVYVLNITADIANILGETLADSATYEFKTDSGKVSAVMGAAKVGDSAVAGFANLKAGDLIKVPVTYVNSTGKAKTLYFVVAYYKNSLKELADVEFITTPFDGTITNGEYEFEHTFKTVEGADSMSFMMWDGFDTLIPLSSSVSLR